MLFPQELQDTSLNFPHNTPLISPPSSSIIVFNNSTLRRLISSLPGRPFSPIAETFAGGAERMDLDEWELLPADGFLDFGGGSEKKRACAAAAADVDPATVFDVDLDYFRCPSPAASELPPVRFHLDPPVKKDPGGEVEAAAAGDDDQDAFSPQVFFKKLKENEFADMKMLESPRSGSRPVSPPIENFRFEDKHETASLEAPRSPRKAPERNADRESVEEVNREGLNLWKWSLSGIGALCSFGVAAATVCTILVVGSHQKNKQSHQKIRFQIYTDDKRIKQVVHHATKLNEAISAARGVPMSRAHITFGGYCEGL